MLIRALNQPFIICFVFTIATLTASAELPVQENNTQPKEAGCFELTGLENGRGYTAVWELPDSGRVTGARLTGFAQRFVSLTPETLRSVTVQHQIPAYFLNDLAMYDSSSTNGFRVSIWPDDGSGNIDNSASPLAVEIIPGGLANLFPVTGNTRTGEQFEFITVDFGPHNLVMLGTWHLSVEATSENPADGAFFLLISHPDLNHGDNGSVNYRVTVPNWENAAESDSWRTDGFGLPFDFLVRPLLCSGSSCCDGSTGNIDADPSGNKDITDLTFLIDHLFINFPELPCRSAANIDGDINNFVDIADLTFLIDHLFISFIPTSDCR